MMGTEEGALAALDADIRLPVHRVPEDGPDDTGVTAESAACAFVFQKAYSPCFDLDQSFFRAGFHARSVFAAAADDDGKPFAHAS